MAIKSIYFIKEMTRFKLLYYWTCIILLQMVYLFTEKKTILYENYVLSVFAQQNFSMYDIVNSKSEAGLISKGKMVSVNSTSNMGAVVRTLCSTPGLKLNTEPTFFMPHWNMNKKSKDKELRIPPVGPLVFTCPGYRGYGTEHLILS